MKLNVLDRILLLGALPKEGNFATLKIVRELRESLSFTDKENKELEFQHVDGGVKWNEGNEPNKEFKINDTAKDIIAEALKELDKQKKLTEYHFKIYEMFVEGVK